ncbi:hypothetical protein [Niallia sp. RD1]|uniref:hypothetical protein n=1 Tax=Niallia sp. RD1 TaxID=2962858 RepID=UPI0020C1A554|nr:hypothetical protein [Niallia sp. RD1]UTI43845.1 hypothetical protein NKG37_09445 [Niallia sp. RD1]
MFVFTEYLFSYVPSAYPLKQWVAIDSSNLIEDTATLTVKVGDVSIEIKEGFSHSLLNEVLQVLQSHVK